MNRKNNSNTMSAIVVMLLLITFGGFGCASMAMKVAGGPVISTVVEKIQNVDSARLLKDGFAGDLLLITAVTEMAPKNFRLLKECSFGYFAYALIVEDEDPEYAKELLTIGRNYGIRALEKNRKFAKGLEQGKKIHELVDDLPKKYAEVLCWTALNDGFLLILNLDDPAALIAMANVVKMAKRSIELNENYFYGAASGFIASYYALVPKFADPDAGPENSKKMFQKTRDISAGKLLLINYLEARFLALTMDDEDLFEERLKSVLEGDSGALEGAKVFNEVAKAKAKYYLDHKDEFF